MLKDEMQALSNELREVREARHVLLAVRNEAAQAIQAVATVKEHPEEAAKSLGVPAPTSSDEVADRLNAVERSNVDILVSGPSTHFKRPSHDKSVQRYHVYSTLLLF